MSHLFNNSFIKHTTKRLVQGSLPRNDFLLESPADIDIRSLQVWYDASVPSILSSNTIHDLSGKGHHMPVIASVTQANNTFFNNVTSNVNNTTDLTVSELSSNFPLTFALVGFQTRNSRKMLLEFDFIPSTTNRLNVYFDTEGAAIGSGNTFPLYLGDDLGSGGNKKVIIVGRSLPGDNSTYEYWINGNYAGTVNRARTLGQFRLFGTFGSVVSGTVAHEEDKLQELTMFNSRLSDIQLKQLFQYCSHKWSYDFIQDVDLFITAGQSNAVGFGEAHGPTPSNGWYVDAYWLNPTRIVPLADPVGPDGSSSMFARQANIGSAWPQFCRTYNELTGRYAIFHSCARGSTSILDTGNTGWNILGVNLPNGAGHFLNVVDSAKIRINKELNLRLGSTAVIWHQGEADRTATVEVYQPALQKLFELFLTKVDYVFYYEIAPRGDGTGELAHLTPRIAQRNLNRFHPRVHLIGTCEFLHTHEDGFSDSVHYSTFGYNRMGEIGATSIAREYLRQRSKLRDEPTIRSINNALES